MKDNFKEKYDNVVKYLKANVLTDKELCLTVLCSFLAGVIVGMVASPKRQLRSPASASVPLKSKTQRKNKI